MKKQTREITEYVLDEKDVKVLRQVLNYAYHRASQHTCYITQYEEEIDKMRKELDKQ